MREERAEAVRAADRRGLGAGCDQTRHHEHDLVGAHLVVLVVREYEIRHKIFLRLLPSFAGQCPHVFAELRHRVFGSLPLLRAEEGADSAHGVAAELSPVKLIVALGRNARDATDDRVGNRLRERVIQVDDAVALSERPREFLDDGPDVALHALHGPRRERGRDEAAHACVLIRRRRERAVLCDPARHGALGRCAVVLVRTPVVGHVRVSEEPSHVGPARGDPSIESGQQVNGVLVSHAGEDGRRILEVLLGNERVRRERVRCWQGTSHFERA